MKRGLFLLVMLMVLLLSALNGQQVEKKEFAVSPGKKLDVDMKTGGELSILGWDQPKIESVLEYNEVPKDSCTVDYETVDGGLRIVIRPKERHVHGTPSLTLRVPRTFDLELRTMGGAIQIDGVSGEIRGKTMGGALKLSHLKGTLEMTTMGGEIDLRDSEVGGSVRTMGGRVQVENVVGDVKASSMGGSVIYRNVKGSSGQAEGNGQVVRLSTMGGEINLEEAMSGADVHTMGGDIRIKKVAKFVKAATMGGDIDIDWVDGSVSASTMGGDVTVNEAGGNGKEPKTIKLSTMGGDLTLTVPAGLDMEIYLEIALPRKHGREGKIYSDFPVEQTREMKTGKMGHDTEYLVGRGKTGSGLNKVTLSTMGGDVYLKKGK